MVYIYKYICVIHTHICTCLYINSLFACNGVFVPVHTAYLCTPYACNCVVSPLYITLLSPVMVYVYIILPTCNGTCIHNTAYL